MKSLKNSTDQDLVKSYASGNNEAFEVLLMRYKTSVYNYIYFILKDENLAEDIFQETFIKAIVNIRSGRYAETGKFSAWITRIAHNLIIDHFRKISNENTVSNDSVEFDMLNNARLCQGNIEEDLVQEQRLKDVVKLMEQLPELQRQVVKMRFYENLSFLEIAEKTGVSINTALGRMRYALLNMKKIAAENSLSFD